MKLSWNTREVSRTTTLIECGNVLIGSIVQNEAKTFNIEIMWSGPGGDLTSETPNYLCALSFIEGVEKMMMRLGVGHHFGVEKGNE